MKKINADTQLKTEQMNKSVEANKQAVIDNLIGFTCDIKSQVHVNFRPTAAWRGFYLRDDTHMMSEKTFRIFGQTTSDVQDWVSFLKREIST